MFLVVAQDRRFALALAITAFLTFKKNFPVCKPHSVAWPR